MVHAVAKKLKRCPEYPKLEKQAALSCRQRLSEAQWGSLQGSLRKPVEIYRDDGGSESTSAQIGWCGYYVHAAETSRLGADSDAAADPWARRDPREPQRKSWWVIALCAMRMRGMKVGVRTCHHRRRLTITGRAVTAGVLSFVVCSTKLSLLHKAPQSSTSLLFCRLFCR